MKYTPTIGLEVHAELKTVTKMFCSSKNDPDEKRPNVNVCPVCMAHPGTLPVINREAVSHVLRMGTAIGGTLADFSEFDRKNYYYPDIPKGYQISQYKFPLVTGGELSGVAVTRIHLEEDTARSSHDHIGKNGDTSFVDFNRAGVPLMELVTEPVIHDAQTASTFAKELQLLLRTLGASEANMEKGEMRVEANISISATREFGTKVEVKNLNSFKAVEKAIAYEIDRHTKLLEKGEKVVQETRGWNENLGTTFSQRRKEEANDYRYFPDPDLPKLKISQLEQDIAAKLAKELPELPSAKRIRLVRDYGVSAEGAEMFVTQFELGEFFEKVALELGNKPELVRLASNYLVSDYMSLIEGDLSKIGTITPEHFSSLIHMLGEKEVSSRGAKDVLAHIYKEGGDPKTSAESLGVLQKSNEDELQGIVAKVIAANPAVVAEYRSGKDAVLQYLVGQVMKESKGSANPGVSAKLLSKMIKEI